MIHIKTFPHFKRYLRMDALVLLTPFFLSGCMGIYEGGFECPPGKGLGCTSISDVNEHINQGYGTRNNPSERELRDEECVPCKGKACLSTPKDAEIWFAPWSFSDQVSVDGSGQDI